MRYYGAHDDPERGMDLRRSYLDAMTRFVTTLVEEGRDVRLLVGDDVDLDTAHALADAVRVRMPELPSSALVVCDADDLGQLVDEMSGCGVIVASRYHNVISGLLSQRPVVSVAYGPKNTALMERVGLGDFCQDIDALDVDRLLEQLRSVEGQWPRLQPLLAEYLRSFREQTDGQLRRLANAMPKLDLDPTPDGRISKRSRQD
jgi:polysaccharide pyruvyl transferase WcaK-like protein